MCKYYYTTISFAIIGAMLLSILSGAVAASEADRILLETLEQLRKIKTQVDAIQPGRNDSVNRYKRQMKLVRSRLDSSKTTDVSEYREASNLFNEVMAKLDGTGSVQTVTIKEKTSGVGVTPVADRILLET
ncbi:MAG: hypothetical protein GY941_12435, partial [Planctomycetes bacterium]|nr:hypothetical protein [Planctomycetota bacterium]